MKEIFSKRMKYVQPSAIRELLAMGAREDIISFGGGYPAPELFPVEAMKVVFEDVLDRVGTKALQYSLTEGIPELREKIAARMAKSGVPCESDDVIVVQGGQQGLDLIAKLYINPGDVIITEQPTFLGALIAFNPYEPQYKSIPMDEEGMRMDALEEALKETPNVKLIYTVPDFHNPTGITMSLERRKALIALANQYGVVVIEDTPYREIRYEGTPIPPIKHFDTEGRVIYLGSFSKILAPGMRLGWVSAEQTILQKIGLLKLAADTQSSTLNMYLAEGYMRLYDLDAHIEDIRTLYKKKKDLMVSIIQSEFPASVKYTNPEGGLFLWMTFPEEIRAEAFLKDHLIPKAKVAYVVGDGFYPLSPEYNHCRINYSGASEEQIIKGMTAFGHLLKEQMKYGV
jgi:2-aminoadipate transaminase